MRRRRVISMKRHLPKCFFGQLAIGILKTWQQTSVIQNNSVTLLLKNKTMIENNGLFPISTQISNRL